MSALPLSPVRGDPTAATRALLALAQEQWEREHAAVDERRRSFVIAALDAGMTLDEVAKAMGLTRGRVYQIKHDTR